MLESIYEEALAFEFELRNICYLRAMDKRVGLLLNFNVEKLKDGIKRLII